MSVRVEPRPEAVVVSAEPRLGVTNRQALKGAVLAELENGRRTVVIDFGQTEIIDSAGLGLLVSLHRCADEMGARVILANLPSTRLQVPTSFADEMSALLRLTKLDTVLAVSRTVDEALSAATYRDAAWTTSSESAPAPSA